MKRKRTKEETIEFITFLHKLKERLIIMLDFNTQNGVDPVDEDIKLLHELYDTYVKSDVNWALKEAQDGQDVTQLEISDKN